MGGSELDIAIKVVTLVFAICGGLYGFVRTAIFVYASFLRQRDARLKKENGWTAQDIRIAGLTDRFTGVLNELQGEMKLISKAAGERDKRIHERLDEHINSDNNQFGTVLRSLGKIEGRLGIPQEEG